MLSFIAISKSSRLLVRIHFLLKFPTVSEFAKCICDKYGARMRAMLIDPKTNELNERGTMFVNEKGMRVSAEDILEDGETITFLVGIAGG